MPLHCRWVGLTLMAALALAFASLPASSQFTFNEHEVKSTPSKLDKTDVWTLDFRFKNPRLIKVNVPGRGTRICWYMCFSVINRTGEPRRCNPIFELVTLDSPGLYVDEPLPSVEDKIRRLEDSTGILEMKSPVQIGL